MAIATRGIETSQGPLNEVAPRVSNRVGGTLGGQGSHSIGGNHVIMPVANGRDLDGVFSSVEHSIGTMWAQGNTRLTVRVLVQEEMMTQFEEALRSIGVGIEARMTVGGGQYLVYVGHNGESRRLGAEEASIMRSLRDAESSGSRQELHNTALRTIRDNDLRFEIVDGTKGEQISSVDYNTIVRLLSVFGYSPLEAISNANDSITVLGRTSEGTLASIAMASRLTLAPGFTLTELTDFVTSREVAGQRAPYAMTVLLLNHLHMNPVEGSELVYAEARLHADSPSTMPFTFAQLGATSVGVLPNHLRMFDNGPQQDPSSVAFSSFAVMPFNPAEVAIRLHESHDLLRE